MQNCAYCKNPLAPLAQWKGDDGLFYCSEFCADAGETARSAIASPPPDVDRFLATAPR